MGVAQPEQGVIGLPRLQGVTFPDEIANATNKVHQSRGVTMGYFAPTRVGPLPQGTPSR